MQAVPNLHVGNIGTSVSLDIMMASHMVARGKRSCKSLKIGCISLMRAASAHNPAIGCTACHAQQSAYM